MDLTFFILIIILIGIIYYLVRSIQSLIKELQEVKMKCIREGSAKPEDFVVKTEDPGIEIKQKALSILKNLKYILSTN